MTFEEFQSTRTLCADLGAKLSDASWNGEPAARGMVYLDSLYIDEVMSHWPNEALSMGRWHLLIERNEWISDDLESLELRLYEFAVSEGY